MCYSKNVKPGIMQNPWSFQWLHEISIIKRDFMKSLFISSNYVKSLKVRVWNSKIFKEICKWKIFEINELTHRKSIPKLPSWSTEQLLKDFSDFFVQKIEKIRQVIPQSIPPNQDLTYAPQHQLLSSLEILNPATEEEIEKIISASKSTSCSLDALPTTLLKNACRCFSW